MTHFTSTYLKHFYIPITLFFIAIVISVKFSHFWLNYDNLLPSLPYVLFIAAGVVALYLLQYAIVYTTILFAFTYALIQLHLQSTLTQAFTYSIYVFANCLFPLLLMACVLLGQKTLTSFWSIVLIVLCSSLLWLPWLIQSVELDTWLQSLPNNMFKPFNENTWFSPSMLITYIPVILFLGAYYYLNPVRLHALWIVGLLAVLVVFVFFSTMFISAITFSIFSFLVLIALLQEAFSLAYVDELTGIASRKALQKQLLGLGKNYSIAMLDVDHFKKFNDSYGHDVGDQVLKMVASKINQVGGGGKAYRYGGEEFVIVFANKTLNESLKHLEQVRQTVSNYRISLRNDDRPNDDLEGKKQRQQNSQQNTEDQNKKGITVTISIGATQRSNTHKKPENAIKDADKALYKAKETGRNCVRLI